MAWFGAGTDGAGIAVETSDGSRSQHAVAVDENVNDSWTIIAAHGRTGHDGPEHEVREQEARPPIRTQNAVNWTESMTCSSGWGL